MSDRTIVGHCPMGCGTTLFVGNGGYITCSYIGCPRPDAVAAILGEQETEHIVQLTPTDFAIIHPLPIVVPSHSIDTQAVWTGPNRKQGGATYRDWP